MKKTSFILIIGAAILLIVAGVWYSMRGKAPQAVAPQPNPEPAGRTVGAGEHCGGNIMNPPVCGVGFHCAPTPGSHLPYGDVGGTCMAD